MIQYTDASGVNAPANTTVTGVHPSASSWFWLLLIVLAAVTDPTLPLPFELLVPQSNMANGGVDVWNVEVRLFEEASAVFANWTWTGGVYDPVKCVCLLPTRTLAEQCQLLQSSELPDRYHGEDRFRSAHRAADELRSVH